MDSIGQSCGWLTASWRSAAQVVAHGSRSVTFRLVGRAMELRKAENIASVGHAIVNHSANRVCGEQVHTFSGLPRTLEVGLSMIKGETWKT